MASLGSPRGAVTGLLARELTSHWRADRRDSTNGCTAGLALMMAGSPTSDACGDADTVTTATRLCAEAFSRTGLAFSMTTFGKARTSEGKHGVLLSHQGCGAASPPLSHFKATKEKHDKCRQLLSYEQSHSPSRRLRRVIEGRGGPEHSPHLQLASPPAPVLQALTGPTRRPVGHGAAPYSPSGLSRDVWSASAGRTHSLRGQRL